MPNLLYPYLSKPQQENVLFFKQNKRTAMMLVSLIFGAALLTGCGQKGSLYLPEEAPSNTDFILHKANKSDSDTPQEPIKGPDISEDPQDY